MNATAPVLPLDLVEPGIEPMAGAMLPAAETGFVADWTDMTFLHFSLPPEIVAPHTSFPPDVHEGRTFVSLVFFRLDRMRIPGAGWLGRALLRPLSDHFFLNVRAYVRGPAGPGIEFLREWIPNPLALRVGPPTYGLPYRLGRFVCRPPKAADAGELDIHEPGRPARLHFELPVMPAALGPCAAGSDDEFLLERYVAYTRHREKRRYFRVSHAPWSMARVGEPRHHLELVERAFPWLASARFHSAHVTPGVIDVRMGRPHRIDV